MPDTNELLINYLDKNLSETEAARVSQLISEDKAMNAEWAYIRLAVEAVELGAIREQVLQARQSFQKKTAPGGLVRSLYRTGLRVAAMLILVLGVSIAYKYTSVNNETVFNQQFTEYNLNTSRGEQLQNPLEAVYRSKNWQAVISLFNQEATKTNESYFLAGMAAMELKNYPLAVAHFETILQANEKAGGSYFQDEAAYYLSLAYLMNGQTAKGVGLLNQIRADKNQTYNPQARRISSTDLKIIGLKNKN